MKKIITINNVVNNQEISAPFICGKDKSGYSGEKIFSELMTSGGTDNFINYSEQLDRNNNQEIVVLSSRHYYYDENDLKNIRILINLNKLNLINYLNVFLKTLALNLPPNANFMGYFSDSETVKGKRYQLNKLSRLFNRFKNFLNSSTDHLLTISEVTKLLERNGFEVFNMTKMKGLTYFNSYNTRRPVELKI